MKDLLPLGEKIGALLKARKQTIVVAESSTGGLISAALLAVPGASAYFMGGGVLYTRKSIAALKGMSEDMFAGKNGCTEEWAKMIAGAMKEQCGTTWGLGESGATGPTGNRYGDPAGTSSIVVIGPVERAIRLQTGSADRVANMRAFSAAALELFLDVLGKQKG